MQTTNLLKGTYTCTCGKELEIEMDYLQPDTFMTCNCGKHYKASVEYDDGKEYDPDFPGFPPDQVREPSFYVSMCVVSEDVYESYRKNNPWAIFI